MNRRLIFALVLILLAARPAAARRDPGANWRQFATEHFLLIYPASATETAANAAEVAERYYPKEKDLFGFAPEGRTPIVLNALREESNAYAQGIFTKLEFYLATPSEKWNGTHDDSWLESLFTHEYAHLCHGLRAEGLTRALTGVFGGVNATNFIAPGWWNEGVAEYAETALTRGGRGRNPYQDMVLAATLLDRPWSLAQCGTAPRYEFPFDRIYLAGYPLVAGLAAYGGEAGYLARVTGEQSSATFFFTNFSGAGAARGLEDLANAIWRERLQAYRQRFGAERPAATDVGELAHEPGVMFRQPTWLDAETLACLRDSPADGPGLIRISISGGLRRVLSEPARLIGTLAYRAATREFFYGRMVNDPVYDDTRRLELFILGPTGERRLTAGGHCASPDMGADGRLVCVVNDLGPNHLALCDPASGALTAIPGRRDAVYLSPRWSPDGRRLAAAVRIRGRQDICLIDPKTGALTPLTGWDEAGDHDPAWSPDGKTVFFVSDRTGVHQIYACPWESGELFRVTDSHLGAFEPAVSPDGKRLAFAEYCLGNAQALMTAPLDSTVWIPVPKPEPVPEPAAAPPASALIGEAYSPWPHLRPTFWLPYGGWDRDGLLLGGYSARRDPLELHEWRAQVLLSPVSGKVYGDLLYMNSESPLVLAVEAFGLPEFCLADDSEGNEKPLWFRKTGGALSATLPLSWLEREGWTRVLNLQGGGEAFRLDEAEGVFPGETYTGGFGYADFIWARQEARDLFPTLGVSAYLQGRAAGAGAFDGRELLAGLILDLPSPLAHQALHLRADARKSTGVFPENAFQVWRADSWLRVDPQVHSLVAFAGYRLPVWRIDDGPGLWPVFFHGAWVEGFGKIGGAWYGPAEKRRWDLAALGSLGVKLKLEAEVFWYLPAQASFMASWRQDGRREVSVDFSLGLVDRWLPARGGRAVGAARRE